jgi:hypothetical protein
MTVDRRIADSASDVESLELCDVFTSGWVAEEPSESKVDKKDSARPVTGTYHEIVWFNIEMNVMVIMQ